MPVTIATRKADPQEWEELFRSFKPLTVSERDVTKREIGDDLLLRIVQIRVREVAFVDPDDANAIKRIAFKLGPATGGDAITIPCAQAVDMAQVMDIFESYMAERMPQHLAERAARQDDRDKRFFEGLVREADEQTKRKLGLSTFGPGGSTQRSKA